MTFWHVVPRLDHVLPPVKAALFKSKMFAIHFKCKTGELLCKKKTHMSSENTHSNMWLLCSICSLYVLKIGEGPLHGKTSASTLLDFWSADARATGFTSAWRPNQSPASHLGYKFEDLKGGTRTNNNSHCNDPTLLMVTSCYFRLRESETSLRQLETPQETSFRSCWQGTWCLDVYGLGSSVP